MALLQEPSLNLWGQIAPSSHMVHVMVSTTRRDLLHGLAFILLGEAQVLMLEDYPTATTTTTTTTTTTYHHSPLES
jgi:hypothetical protein